MPRQAFEMAHQRNERHCAWQAIASATSESFSALRRKLGARGKNGVPSAEKPFFDVAVELSIPNVNINPPLEAIQAAITTTAKQVLSLVFEGSWILWTSSCC